MPRKPYRKKDSPKKQLALLGMAAGTINPRLAHNIRAEKVSIQYKPWIKKELRARMQTRITSEARRKRNQELLQGVINAIEGRTGGAHIVKGGWVREANGEWVKPPVENKPPIKLNKKEKRFKKDAMVKVLKLHGLFVPPNKNLRGSERRVNQGLDIVEKDAAFPRLHTISFKSQRRTPVPKPYPGKRRKK